MASNAQHDVIIAGAGPIGLFLACELAMRKVSVIILERDADPSNPWYVTPTPKTKQSIG
jgi:2-polyprenyl-6-methoxyphenol hydroxylase-like FAD-dependent oxidoreductase